jgi:hypothetical protein
VDLEVLTGYIRQLAQATDQERAVVAGPESILHTTASQRSFTIKGFERLGVDSRDLVARYREAFGEDLDKLIDLFDRQTELKRNEWGIPVGIVKNRVDVFQRRASAGQAQGQTAEGAVAVGVAQAHGAPAPPSREGAVRPAPAVPTTTGTAATGGTRRSSV